MKKLFKSMSMAALMAAFLMPPSGECARQTFHEWLQDREAPVKTFASDITDSSGEASVALPLVKENLQKTLLSRKKVKFDIVNDQKDADMIISCDIVEYFWSATDPIDDISGSASLLIDAAINEHYARMAAVFIIKDAKTGEVLWRSKVKATLTGNYVTKENYATLLSERIIKVLTRVAIAKSVDGRIINGGRHNL